MKDSEGPDEALRSRLAAARDRGLASLLRQQSANGSFPFGVIRADGGLDPCHPLFSTVTVLLAVGHLLPAEALARALDFIAADRRADGMWHYDPAMDIPADADDTACALACLASWRPGSVGEADAALLRGYWRPDGGPFKTWQHSDNPMWNGRERDDAIVNANIVHALNLLGSPPSGVEREGAIAILRSSAERTRYYCAESTIAYAALRAGLPREAIPQAVQRRPAADQGSLALAQWLCAAAPPQADVLETLLAGMQADGSWPIERWCSGWPHEWGSAAITTAICVEALARALARH